MNITAVVLSPVSMRDPVLPPGVKALVYVPSKTFRSHRDMNAARRAALSLVDTPHWFFYDSDDTLPGDVASVLDECLGREKTIVYTNERIYPGRDAPVLRNPGEYSEDAFIRDVLMVHHTVLCETEATRAALDIIPDGRELMESCLYFQLAKSGISYVDRVGYNWNKHDRGMHGTHDALEYVTRAAAWCARNRS